MITSLPLRSTLLLAGLVLLNSGCAHMRSVLYDPPHKTLASKDICPGTTTTVQKARDTICRVQQDYQRAIYGATEISDGVWSALLATGASAVGLALTGTTGAPLVATTLFTTTGAVHGKLFLQPEIRGNIFQAGASATSCLFKATAPLVPAEERLESLESTLAVASGLPAKIAKLQVATEALNLTITSIAGTAPNDPRLPAARTTYNAAKTLVGAAQTAYTNAAEFPTQLSNNVQASLSTLQEIRSAVSGAARSASPDLANLQATLKTIKVQGSDMIGFLVPAAAAASAGAAATEQAGKLRTTGPGPAGLAPPDELRMKADAVADAIGPVTHDVTLLATVTPSIHVADMTSTLQDCINKVQNLDVPTLKPTFLQLQPGQTGSVSIAGGSGNYTTQVIGPTGSLQVTQTAAGTKSAKIDITVPQTTTAGSSFAVLVSDPERRFSQAVTVEVVAAPQKLAAKASPDTALPPTAGSKVTFTISGGVRPYTSLGPASGDQASDAALTVEPVKKELPADKPTIIVTLKSGVGENKTYKTVVSDATGDQLALEVKVGAKPKAEALASPSEADVIRKAQTALKAKGIDPGPIDGILGPKTTAALKQFQKSVGVPETGVLDNATKEKLEL